MEKDFGSECSSECESGWTFYLGHSMYPCQPLQKSKNHEDDEDDDDMSMVSDASSGPPHFQEQECNNNGVNKIQDFPCFRDDTFSYVGDGKASEGESDNVADYSEGESRYCEDEIGHFSVCGTPLQQSQLRKP